MIHCKPRPEDFELPPIGSEIPALVEPGMAPKMPMQPIPIPVDPGMPPTCFPLYPFRFWCLPDKEPKPKPSPEEDSNESAPSDFDGIEMSAVEMQSSDGVEIFDIVF